MTERILLSANEVRYLVNRLASAIKVWKPTVVVPILSGAYFLGADLHRELFERGIDAELFPIIMKRDSKGRPQLHSQVPHSRFADQRVLVVDTIYCTGATSRCVIAELVAADAVAAAFLFCRGYAASGLGNVSVFVGRYLGMNQDYLVGYGLDRNQKSRGSPIIWTESPSDQVPEAALVKQGGVGV